MFKVRASNINGWGAFSSILTIKASSVPATMSTVTTSIDSSSGSVLLSWSPPSNTGS